MIGALAGIHVLEIAGEMAVPIAGMLLGDNGAEVIKVEPPGGDPLRALPGARVWNRGKLSLTLDIEQPDGRAALERLLPETDVVLTGLGPAELGAQRLDAAT